MESSNIQKELQEYERHFTYSEAKKLLLNLKTGKRLKFKRFSVKRVSKTAFVSYSSESSFKDYKQKNLKQAIQLVTYQKVRGYYDRV